MRFCVNPESSKKLFNPLKNVDNSIFASSDILNCLRKVRVTMAFGKLLRILTERRMPTPAKITFAGGNACYINERVELEQICPEAYHASTRFKNRRESLQNVYGWIEPFGPSSFATPGLI
jgi:hypothetical protein